MTARLQKILIVLTLILNSASANAIFVPTPVRDGNHWAVDFGADMKMYWDPTFTLRHIGPSVAMSYDWEGFATGLQVRGGVNDNVNGLFRGTTDIKSDLGGDVMARYLFDFCSFYFGIQTVFGVDYLFDNNGTVDSNLFLNLSFGIPVGLNFGAGTSVYLMPMLELGNRSATDTKVWGTLVSGSIAVGAAIRIGGPSIVLEVTPRIDDFSRVGPTSGVKTFIGLRWEM